MNPRERRDVMEVAIGGLPALRALEEKLEETIQTLAHRMVQDCNLIVSTGPLSPLTSVQNVQMHLAAANVVRAAVAKAREHERALVALSPIPPLPVQRTVIVHPGATDASNPHFTDEDTTRPMGPERFRPPDLGDQ